MIIFSFLIAYSDIRNEKWDIIFSLQNISSKIGLQTYDGLYTGREDMVSRKDNKSMIVESRKSIDIEY